LPGLILTLPVSLLAVVAIASKPAWWSAVASILGASGVTYLGAQVIRSFGQRVEPALWKSWGGAPTTQLLRFKGSKNTTKVTRWHELLAKLMPDVHLPNADEESKDPEGADAAYETVVSVLIAKTRDTKKFARIFDENCEYGYRRNLYSCRRFGYLSGIVSLLAIVGLASAHAAGAIHLSVLGICFVALADVVGLILLKWIVTPQWVHEAADAYASRLIESVEVLEPDKSKLD